jgi:hypothetical protein
VVAPTRVRFPVWTYCRALLLILLAHALHRNLSTSPTTKKKQSTIPVQEYYASAHKTKLIALSYLVLDYYASTHKTKLIEMSKSQESLGESKTRQHKIKKGKFVFSPTEIILNYFSLGCSRKST